MKNLRGSIFTVLAMAAFALEDMFVKAASSNLPVGKILILIGLGVTFTFIITYSQKNENYPWVVITQQEMKISDKSVVQ